MAREKQRCCLSLESTLSQQRGAKCRDSLLPDWRNRSVVSGNMITARKVALRVNGVRTANARVRRVQKGLELVITDPRLGEFVADENFTLELLELLHPHEIRRDLPNGGWRRVSLRILIALLGSGVVRVAEES